MVLDCKVHLIIEQGKYKSKYPTGPYEHKLLLLVSQNKGVSSSKELSQAMLARLTACVVSLSQPGPQQHAGTHTVRCSRDCEYAASSSACLGVSRK